MSRRSNKITEAGPELIPGARRVEPEKVDLRVGGALVALSGLAAAVWMVHIIHFINIRATLSASFKAGLVSTWLMIWGLFMVSVILLGFIAEGVFEKRWTISKWIFGRMRLQKRLPEISYIPSLAQIFFLLIPKRSRDHLVGDLEEEYQDSILPAKTGWHARCWWWCRVFEIVGFYIWKKFRHLLTLEFVRGLRRH